MGTVTNAFIAATVIGTQILFDLQRKGGRPYFILGELNLK